MSDYPPLHVGIDIGADKIHVATSPLPSVPIHEISLKCADWDGQLIAIIPPGSTVAYEPTGWHYSAPVVTLLHHVGCTVIQVEHRVTGMIRTLRISGVKKDLTDAQALAYIAAQHATTPLRGTHITLPEVDQSVTALRMLIWSQIRAEKECTRASNRLRQLAHSVWPCLDEHLTAYRHAIEHGYVSPRELRNLYGTVQIAGKAIKTDPTLSFYAHATRRKELFEIVNCLPIWLNGEHLRDVIALEAAALATHERQSAQVADLIDTAIHAEPFADLTRLWLSIPGAGPFAIAALIVACHGAPAELNAAQFRATVGSHPHIAQSGEDEQSREARQGFKPAKRAIYLWTMWFMQPSNRPSPIAAVFDRRKARGQDYAIQAARAKLVNILWGIARTGTPYDPSLFAPESEEQP